MSGRTLAILMTPIISERTAAILALLREINFSYRVSFQKKMLKIGYLSEFPKSRDQGHTLLGKFPKVWDFMIYIILIYLSTIDFKVLSTFPYYSLKTDKESGFTSFSAANRSIVMVEVPVQLHPESQDFSTDISKHD